MALTDELRQLHQEARPDVLPAGYYLENFEYLISFVTDRYPSLLQAEEHEFENEFLSLQEPSKKLYVRLLNRKGQFFRVDKLAYEDIPDIDSALEGLAEYGFVRSVLPPVDEALKLCNRAELLTHVHASGLPASSRKPQLEASFIDAGINPLDGLQIPVVEQLKLEICEIYRLLFFGNFHQGMTEFVLHELVAPFESYDLDVDDSLFSSRSVIDALFELKVLSEQSYELIESDEQGDSLIELAARLPERPDERLLARRFDRVVNRVARQLERLNRPKDALQIFKLSRSVPSRERQVRLLEKLGKVEAALDLCESIAQAPENEEELEFAHQFGARQAKKYKSDGRRFVRPVSTVKAETIQIPRVDNRVEISARSYYERAGHDAYYVENALLRSLFGLYFWDVIYAPVKGAFFHPFQRGPADLYTPDFVPLRQEMIDQKFCELESTFQTHVTKTLRDKFGTANQFVYWGLFDDALLKLCFDNLPPQHLTQIFRRMLADLRNNTNGLPDLILFRDNAYQMVEIKGPGDKLQKNQIRWFRFFHQQSIPATVVNIEYENP